MSGSSVWEQEQGSKGRNICVSARTLQRSRQQQKQWTRQLQQYIHQMLQQLMKMLQQQPSWTLSLLM
jgi:hypothetical protein